MMCCHGGKAFFNKKNRDWTSRTLANPPTSENFLFLPYPFPSNILPLASFQKIPVHVLQSTVIFYAGLFSITMLVPFLLGLFFKT